MQRGKVEVSQYSVTDSRIVSISGSWSVHSRNFSPILSTLSFVSEISP